MTMKPKWPHQIQNSRTLYCDMTCSADFVPLPEKEDNVEMYTRDHSLGTTSSLAADMWSILAPWGGGGGAGYLCNGSLKSGIHDALDNMVILYDLPPWLEDDEVSALLRRL